MTLSIRPRDHLIDIWQAGVNAVRSEGLVKRKLSWNGTTLQIEGDSWSIHASGRILVVGTGKAGAGMAAATEEVFADECASGRLSGWVNVPEDCVRPLRRITLHGSRPKSLNEPTQAGVDGTAAILEQVRSLSEDDTCLVLISGGGSALMPAPVPGITLADKQAVTRFLSSAGATIQDLNAVRKRLSLVKGGGLARACRAGRLFSLIISDVVGDPLDVIASGPTVPDTGTPQQALDILRRYGANRSNVPDAIWNVLEQSGRSQVPAPPLSGSVRNYIIGNNRLAMDAAARRANELGYDVLDQGSNNQGDANSEGRALVRYCWEQQSHMKSSRRPLCVLSGGEPVVKLSTGPGPRKGGRNQQLILAALMEIELLGANNCSLLSGGTDGEDGPTDAAGAIVDQQVLQAVKTSGLDPHSYLERNDAYHFFERCGGLFKTGPTHTNVMDLRVALLR